LRGNRGTRLKASRPVKRLRDQHPFWPKRLIGRPQSFALRESEATATNVLSARKQQSDQPERKSTTRYGDEP